MVPNFTSTASVVALTIFLAADLSGPAQVKDGDSIVVAGREIRLHGIDAPESNEECKRDGKKWMAGRDAAAFLRSLIEGKPIACARVTTDAYRRVVATCFSGGENINETMVRSGWALAYRRYSTQYVEAEESAKTARAGIWAGECPNPEEWRKSKQK